MTVKELILELATCDPEMSVTIAGGRVVGLHEHDNGVLLLDEQHYKTIMQREQLISLLLPPSRMDLTHSHSDLTQARSNMEQAANALRAAWHSAWGMADTGTISLG